MANHVTTWIEVKSDKEEVYQHLVDMFRGSTWEDHGQTLWLYNKLYNLPADSEEYDRETYTERMGAKWCYIDEVSTDNEYFEMVTTSAWEFCDGAIMRLHEILSAIDEDVLIRFTYEDESLDPVGGGGVFRGEMEHYREDLSHLWESVDFEGDDSFGSDDMWDKVADTKNELMVEACDDLMLMNEEEDEDEE